MMWVIVIILVIMLMVSVVVIGRLVYKLEEMKKNCICGKRK